MFGASTPAPPSRALVLSRWLLVALGLLACTLLDRWVYAVATIDRNRELWNAEWWQVLRQAGNIMPWAFVAAALMMHDRKRLAAKAAAEELQADLFAKAKSAFLHRGSMIFLAAGLGGLAAEILKGISQRGRPTGLGVYRFGWVEQVSGYGMASSHAGVAFGAAFMLGKLFPGALWPLLLLACGTCFSRLTPGAHYLSDLYVAGVLAWLVTQALWRLLGRAPGGHAHAVTLIGK